ncbi:MAG: carbohydrate binding family 9 domain-containing protein [Bacteroidales bacterium]|nr:carbohydrate binding family 9 domain-containing protein [Bacteroidales bacterium]MBN2699624.1 carbohydrate binding family 9 domain-containing protein [Bacteroidales bacterium]
MPRSECYPIQRRANIALISAILLTVSQLLAQEPLIIPKMTLDPELDGNLSEPAWDDLTAIPLVMHSPVAGNVPTERSEFKLGYTDQYFYFAAYNYDSEPDKIQSTSKKRDEMNLNNDFCAISLDTYSDHENALSFCTNPAGARLDMQIMNDGKGAWPVNEDWNAIWEVEIRENEKGWFAEFRIPLSTLRYQVIDGKVEMGLSVFRYVARYSEAYVYPAISNKWGFWSFVKVSQFQPVEIHDIKSINPILFSPYLLGGFQQSFIQNDAGNDYEAKRTWKRTAGMDIKYGLAKNVTLDLTVNTDFAQVEADNQEINLTRYSLFFPEKRQFFMERANVFDFNFGEEGQLFYSRRIGLFEGQSVPIWGGGRLTGRAGKWDLGLMSLQTGFLEGNSGRILETANHSVIRTRRQVALNKNSYLGFMGTSKIERYGIYNLGYGFDAILNLKGDTYLKIAWAQTADSDSPNKMFSLDPSRYLVFLERRNYKGFSYGLSYERSGRSYNPEMGFEFRQDFTRFGQTVSYGIVPDEDSWQTRSQFSLDGEYYFRNGDGSLETINLSPSYYFSSRKNTELMIVIPFKYDDVLYSFDLSDEITIAEGQYRNIGINGSYSTSAEKRLITTLGAYSGKYYGGWRNSASVSPSLSIGSSWRLSLSYYFYRIDFSEPEQVYRSHLMRFRVWYMFSTKLSAMGFVQYNSLNQKFYVNLRFRYNPREGNDLYIVYNDLLNTGRDDFTPELPFSDKRIIMIKYTHTFRVR